MAPPAYADLGKSARDLFSKGYNFGFMQLNSTTKAGAQKEIEFKTGASHNVSTQKMFGNLDVKYKLPQYGMVLTEKWNTENQLGTVVEIQDKVAKGFKLTLDSVFAPNTGRRNGKVKGEWVQDRVKVNADVGLTGGPIINTSAVTGHDGWLLGVTGTYDTQQNKFSAHGVALGRTGPDYALHTFMNNASEFGGSLYHRVNTKVEIGAQIGWTNGQENTRFALATKYTPAKDWTLRAKLANNSQVAISTAHVVNPHLTLTMSGQFNMANFNDGGHKIGLGLEFEPCC